MNDPASTILKVFLLSAVISIVIKYAAPSLAIPNTPSNALIAVLLPPVAMAIALGWRARRGMKDEA